MRSSPVITITLEEDVARAVCFRGGKPVAWATTELAAPGGGEGGGQASGAPEAAEADRASALRGLVQQVTKGRARLVSGLPLYTPLVRHIRLPKVPRRHLDQVVLSEMLGSIPFSQDEIDITWQSRKSAAGREVLTTAVPRRALDEHVGAFREAGVRLAATYSSATALAMAAGQPDVIVVHLGKREASVVLSIEGAPLAVRQERLGETDASAEEDAEALARAVSQVVGYHHSLDPDEGSRPAALPVVLTGRTAGREKLLEAFGKTFQGELLPFEPPTAQVDGFSPAEYATNIGLALADEAWSRKRGRGRRWAAANLLPGRHLPQPLPLQRLAFGGALVLLALLAFQLTGTVGQVEREEAALTQRVEQAQQQERQTRLVAARVLNLQQGMKSTETFIGGLESHLSAVDTQNDTLLAQLKALTAGKLPLGVQLSSVAMQSDGIVVIGTAPGYPEALQYASATRATGRFLEVRLMSAEVAQSGAGNATGSVTFRVKAFTTTPAPATPAAAMR